MPRQMTCPSCSTTGLMPDVPPGDVIACTVCHTAFVPTPVQPAGWDAAGGGDVWGVPLDVPRQPPRPRPPAPALDTRAAGTPPPIDSAAHPPGVGDWMRAEGDRFAAYVREELARLAKARLETAAAVSRAESVRVTQSMGLGKQAVELNARRDKLDARAAELERYEGALADREAELEHREAALSERERENTARTVKRADWERDAAELSRWVTDLRAAVERLTTQRDELEKACATLDERQAALDRRSLDVGSAEVSLQRRASELDDMEAALRTDFEARERDLERQQALLSEEAAALRER
jgi:hypothetical protein